jgi:hypothetical protein
MMSAALYRSCGVIFPNIVAVSGNYIQTFRLRVVDYRATQAEAANDSGKYVPPLSSDPIAKEMQSTSVLEQKPLIPSADCALGSKEAAAACGNVMKLDKTPFMNLNLHTRLARLITDGGFAGEQLTDKNFSDKDLQEQAFGAYALAYLTWDKPTGVSRASLDKKFIDGIGSLNLSDLYSDQRTWVEAYVVKIKRMMLRAFDLGRHDAKTSPCPF